MLAILSVMSLMGRSQRKTALELYERHSVGRALNMWKSSLRRIQVSLCESGSTDDAVTEPPSCRCSSQE